MTTTQITNPVFRFVSVFRYSAVAVSIVWQTSALLTIVMGLATLVSGVLPAAIASVGGMFVDAVSGALQEDATLAEQARQQVLFFVFVEAGLVLLMTAAQRLNTVCQSILRVLLGNKINVMILEKALTLELAHFEDAEYYDKLVRARREASSRPLSLVIKTFDLVRDCIALITIGIWLFSVFSVRGATAGCRWRSFIPGRGQVFRGGISHTPETIRRASYANLPGNGADS